KLPENDDAQDIVKLENDLADLVVNFEDSDYLSEYVDPENYDDGFSNDEGLEGLENFEEMEKEVQEQEIMIENNPLNQDNDFGFEGDNIQIEDDINDSLEDEIMNDNSKEDIDLNEEENIEIEDDDFDEEVMEDEIEEI
ncbi:MAG: hypothetical protein ACOCP8_07390, partial [archaeon]